jgi:predicted TIM-barrel fold metal-dependent hydrolase
MDRYTVISADCHAGAQLYQYRDYLPSAYLADFDDWARDYAIPFEDLRGPDGDRNWNHERRVAEMDADGIVAEVIFPNTIPPFFPTASLLTQPSPTTTELEARWAGLQAHNRWLLDFCTQLPGRRAGVVQIMLHDVDAAVAEIRWAADAGLTGGVLLPGAPPGSGLAPLYSSTYEPIWVVCEELGVPVNHHSGSAVPVMGDTDVGEDLAHVMFMLEVTWWAHRALWHLMFGGAMERHPDLQFVFTEQGTAWIPETLATLDYFAARMATAAGSQEREWGSSVVGQLSRTPSGYWARQCHVGSSFLRPTECELRAAIGVDRIMWGSDYPHLEGCYPYSREALRLTFADVDPAEVRIMVGGNAATLYGFDLDVLDPIAAEIGPTLAEVATPLEHVPPDAERCPAFAGAAPPRPSSPNEKEMA